MATQGGDDLTTPFCLPQHGTDLQPDTFVHLRAQTERENHSSACRQGLVNLP